jgi:outer membrane protein assembly factor BamB
MSSENPLSAKRSKMWYLLIPILGLICVLFWVLIVLGAGVNVLTYQQKDVPYPKQFYTQLEYSLDGLPVEGLLLTKLWEISADGFIDRPPLHRNGVIVLQSDTTIWSVNEEGDLLWKVEANNRINNVWVTDEVVLFNTFASSRPLIAINLKDGSFLWQSSDEVGDADIGKNNSIVVGWNERLLYQSIDAKNGKINWQYRPTNVNVRSLNVISDPHKNLVYIQEEGETIVLNGTSGVIEDRFPTTKIPFPNWVESGTLFFEEATPGKLVAIDSKDYHTLWEVKTPTYKYSPPTFTNSMIYIGNILGKLVAIDRYSGNIVWEYPSPQATTELVSNVAVVNDTVYAIFSDGRLIGFDAKSGRSLGHIQFAGVSNTLQQVTIAGIAASEDTLFVSLGYKKLYAFRIQ